MGGFFNCSILQWGGAGVVPYRPLRSPSQTCLLICKDPEWEVRSPAQAAFFPPNPALFKLHTPLSLSIILSIYRELTLHDYSKKKNTCGIETHPKLGSSTTRWREQSCKGAEHTASMQQGKNRI